jgi:hypothetical protein
MLEASRRTLLALAALAVLGCSDSEAVGIPAPQPVTFEPGTWALVSANGLELPASISTRSISFVQEEVLLDSARIEIAGNGFYEQYLYLSVLHDGTVDRSEVVFDRGRWGPPFAATYAFNSTIRTRVFSVVPRGNQIETAEPVLYFVGAPLVTGLYRHRTN